MKVRVDFNNLVRGGQVRASLRHVDGVIAPGDTVMAFDPSEDLTVDATVVEIDLDRNRVYLEPHWEPAVDKVDVIRKVRLAGTCLQRGGSGTTAAEHHVNYHVPSTKSRVTESSLVSH